MKTFNFPDSTPHIILDKSDFDIDDLHVSIRNTEDLFRLKLYQDIYKPYITNLHYVIGSRMDRRISEMEPWTLKVVCNILKLNYSFNYYVTFPHSQSILDRLDAKQDVDAELSFLKGGIDHICQKFHAFDFSLVLPDAGFEKNFYNNYTSLLNHYHTDANLVSCSKIRDMSTGKLSGFRVNSEPRENCIILDDLADGAKTFTGLAEILKTKGVKKIGLVVYHGIFSKGTNLENIDYIYTSNSFKEVKGDNVFCQKVL